MRHSIIRFVKPRILIPLIIAVLGISLFTPHASAGKPKAKASATPFHQTIESISADSITVKKKSGDVTYKITKDTEITFKGDTVTATQLQAGMRVEVTPDAVDPTVAGTISANDPPPTKGGSSGTEGQ